LQQQILCAANPLIDILFPSDMIAWAELFAQHRRDAGPLVTEVHDMCLDDFILVHDHPRQLGLFGWNWSGRAGAGDL
jgi:hypothetical protein